MKVVKKSLCSTHTSDDAFFMCQELEGYLIGKQDGCSSFTDSFQVSAELSPSPSSH